MATFNAGAIEATLDLDVDPFQRGLASARAEGKKFGAEKFTAKLDVDAGTARSDLAVLRAEFERVARTYSGRVEIDGVAETTAQVTALQAQLAALGDRHTIDVDASTASSSISSARRGLAGMIPLLATLATGLIPLSAAAAPALGLLSNITLTAAAAGTLILAFQGVGATLKAVNAAEIAPTAANLQKAHDALAALTPEARAFIDQLRGMSGAWGDLKDSAAEGFFPGATSALAGMEDQLPRLNPLVYTLANTLGIVADNTVRGLGSPFWSRFLTFVKGEARPGITALTDSVGNLAGGLAGMWMAFDPLNDDFSAWLVDVTQRFEDWGKTLGGSGGMEDFIAYVRQVGPQAGETLGAVANAIVQIVQASAPLGGVVLDVLEHVADAVAAIADAPFGSTLILGAAGLLTLNKGLAITEGLMTKLGVGAGAAAAGTASTGFLGKLGTQATGARGAITGLSGDLRAMRNEYPGLSRSQAIFTSGLSNTTGAAQRTRSTLSGILKGSVTAGAGLAAMGLLATGAGDKLGVTNTAMLGLVATMSGVGPFGVAIAAGIGAFIDFRKQAEGARDAVAAVDQSLSGMMSGGNVAGVFGSSDDLAALDAQRQKIINDTDSLGDALLHPMETLGRGFGHTVDTMGQGYDTLTEKQSDYIAMLKQADDALTGRDSSTSSIMETRTQEVARLTKTAETLAPAMQAAGVSWDDLIHMDPAAQKSTLHTLVQWGVHADSARGRTDAFASSVADLGTDYLRTADSATAMGSALDALLSPQLNAEAATDAWHDALKNLEKTLKDGAGFKGFTTAAENNRKVTRDYVTSSMDRLKALAGLSTTSEKDMAVAVRQTRQEFIQSGMAAGFSRKEITARANAMGLTPAMVKTVFEAAGVTQADLRARKLRDLYRGMPKDVRTALKADGIPETMGDVDRLVKKYDLTEKQRTALISLKDLASKGLGDVLAKLGLVDRTNATPSVNLTGGSSVNMTLGGIFNQLTNLDGKTATTYVNTVHRGGSQPGLALGGPVVGPGTGTSDSIPALLSNGEHVWTAREVANAGGHAAVESMRSQYRYADGGAVDLTAPPRRTVRAPAPGAMARAASSWGLSSADIDRLIRAIEENRGVYAPVSSREELEQAMRGLERELRKVGA